MDMSSAEPSLDPSLILIIVFGAIGLVLGIIYFAACRKKATAGSRCTAKAVGTVVGYDSAHRKGDGFWPAILAYTVGGVEYHVSGPFFNAYVTKSVSTPFSDNSMHVSTEGDVLRVTYSLNSLVTVCSNPYEQLYPRGTQLDVYYNPSDPADAFVERNVASWQYRLIGVMSLVFFALAIGVIAYTLVAR